MEDMWPGNVVYGPEAMGHRAQCGGGGGLFWATWGMVRAMPGVMGAMWEVFRAMQDAVGVM